ncbi:MAG: cupin domain-containing protein [Dysgonomonas sp.]|nr:cupin domain-containing protein [Dysgonomonas sp.]
MKDSNEFLYHNNIEIENVGDGVTRQIMGYNNDMMLVKVEFQTNSIGDIHSHPHTQSSYVVSGRFEVNIDGNKQILSAGDGFFVAPDKPHGVVCIEAGILIDAFSPTRKDFLKD